MAQERKSPPGKLTLMRAQYGEGQADYSYDQWRHAQMRQMEQSYAEMTGTISKPAAA